MPGIFDRVLTVNLIANTAIFYVAARLYLLPLVPRVRLQQILVPILLLHSMRHLGLMFLTRGATFPGMPPQFAYPAVFGDLLTAILAFAAIPFVLRSSCLAKPAVWIFNIFGTLDLLAAITFATIYNAPVTMGPAYWIPAFWVPLLLVTHYVTFVLLGRRWQLWVASTAQHLIRETPRSLIQIALEVGYTSPSHFAQVFRRMVGVTPTEFRSAL